jgi:hypothetical protein
MTGTGKCGVFIPASFKFGVCYPDDPEDGTDVSKHVGVVKYIV